MSLLFNMLSSLVITFLPECGPLEKEMATTPVFLPGESKGLGSWLWWAAVYGVAQSRTQLKRLSSSSQGYGFLVVMYGCESWTVKKAECQRIDAFEL